MYARISTSVVAAALAVPLLAGCNGGGSAPAAPGPTTAGAATPSTSAPVATPTSSTRPSDAKDEVKDAASTFMDQVFTVRYSESSKEYWARARPLVTPRLYPALKKDLDIDDGLDKARARFGSDARAKSKVLGDVQVSKISSDAATTRVKFTIQIQKPEDGGWKTVKRSPEDTATIKLVKDGEDWLVDAVD